MRLYLKLFALIALTVGVQRWVMNDWRKSTTLFLARCFIADVTGDKALTEQLCLDARYFVEQDLYGGLQGNRSNATLPAK